ncbi:MAG: hypothetical protein KC423_23385 [Anaerolineales bacterium]|nr:hypothetical protein [Anaerolineales bacterium]
MLIEIGTPAVLPLGLVKVQQAAGDKLCLLGLTVQHPPVNLFVQQHPGRLDITGARADVGYEAANRFFAHYQKPARAQVEIETTIPAFMGLESTALMKLAMVQGLSWLSDLPHDQSAADEYAQLLGLTVRDGLALAAFKQGGLLLVDMASGEVVQRLAITHERDREAWSLVLFFPRTPPDIDPHFEALQYAALQQAAPAVSEKTGDLVTRDMKKAVQLRDEVAFGQALLLLQQTTNQALAQMGRLVELTAEEQGVVEIMQHSGAIAWGRSATGLALFGLIKGADASRQLRAAVMKQVGYFGGLVMATITDNEGSRLVVKQADLNDNKLPPVRVRPDLLKGGRS